MHCDMLSRDPLKIGDDILLLAASEAVQNFTERQRGNDKIILLSEVLHYRHPIRLRKTPGAYLAGDGRLDDQLIWAHNIRRQKLFLFSHDAQDSYSDQLPELNPPVCFQSSLKICVS